MHDNVSNSRDGFAEHIIFVLHASVSDEIVLHYWRVWLGLVQVQVQRVLYGAHNRI